MKALLEATAYVLRREGWERATTNRIAERAGVNIGSLYQYFPNRESLVAAVIDRLADRYLVRMEEVAVRAREAPLAEGLALLIGEHLAITLKDPPLQRAIIVEIPRVERLDLAVRTKQRLAGMLRDLLVRHADKRVDLDHLCSLVVQIVQSICETELFEKAEPDGARMLRDAHDAAFAFVNLRLGRTTTLES